MRKKYQIYFLIVIGFIVPLTANNIPFLNYLSEFGNDTIPPIDTLKIMNDLPLSNPDTLINDSLDNDISDTLLQNTTEPKVKKSKNAVDAQVAYTSDDSTVINLFEHKIYLYGNAQVNYKEIELKANYIEINFDNNTIFAKGLPDSSGNIQGIPHFKESEDEFDSKEMTYNFKTKKGIIKDVRTKQDEGYLLSDKTKKMANNIICLQDGKYTTCDKEHPDYYIKLKKAKVIPDDKIVSGPAYLVIEDIPLPLALPFGFFPNKKGHSSGVVIPEYGEEVNRGFFLRNGGYYFAINDYVDAKLTGDIYSLGSWGGHLLSNYKKRYKFYGNLNFSYSKIIISEKDLPNYQNQNSYQFVWSHSQDSKARPNSSFRANVNLTSSSYSKYVGTSFDQRMQNSALSNIAYTKQFPRTPFNFSANFRHSQNNTDSSITLSLPELNFQMRRIHPLKRKNHIGKPAFYEEIGLTYTSNMQNKIKFKQDDFSPMRDIENYKNGIKHTIPVSTNFSILKHFIINPSFTYNERWYFKSIRKKWQDETIIGSDTTPAQVVTDTLNGFVRSGDYSLSIPLTTKIYGFYQFFGDNPKIKAIRHLMTPSVSFNYRPDYKTKYGYYLPVPHDTMEQYYSIFGNDPIYGAPQTGKYGSLKFALGNNLEMKTRKGGDTSDVYEKIPLLQSFDINTFYNLAADSMKLSNINISGRTNIIKIFDITFNGVLNPYLLTDSGNVVDKFMWNSKHKIGRLTNARIALSFNVNNNTFSKQKEKKKTAKSNSDYDEFSIPWSLSFSYNWSYSKPIFEKTIVQTARISGNFDLTTNWKSIFTLGYDFTNKKFTYPSVRILRDLHCWAMSLNIIPFGAYQSYSFQINVKASVLQDMKYTQRRNWTEYL